MSVLFLIGFIMAYTGKIDPLTFDTECFIMWALFSIADALWFRRSK